MTIREARLPADEPAILSFINGLQDYEAAFEPNRRRDPAFAADHWRDAQHRCAQKHGIMLIAEDSGKAVGWAFAYELGQTPDREWLLYVQSPREDRKEVEVKVPGFGDTSVDVPRTGAFYHLREGHPTANRVGK